MTDTVWLAVIIVAAYIAVNFRINQMHNHLVEHLDRQTHHIEGLINMSTQDTIDTIVATLAKAKSEIVNEISKLNEQIAAAGVAEQIDTTALEAVAQALDDVVPDAPVDAPAE